VLPVIWICQPVSGALITLLGWIMKDTEALCNAIKLDFWVKVYSIGSYGASVEDVIKKFVTLFPSNHSNMLFIASELDLMLCGRKFCFVKTHLYRCVQFKHRN